MADKVLGFLPDPFLRADGTRVKTKEEWKEHRKYLIDLVVGMEYGGMPPKPEKVEVEQFTCGGPGRINNYRVHIGSFTFCLAVYLPKDISTPRPVILTGDGCYRNMNDLVIDEILGRGMIAAKFNRTELAPDMYNNDRTTGIYPLYPDLKFGALSAWAWGYHRAMDALCTMPFVDKEKVAITGHSRGGKTVLLAGATDERFAYVNPNNSGAGGAGCYRYHTQLDEAPEGGHDLVSETLEGMRTSIPYWFGPDVWKYSLCEEKLPFDQHMLKALVAPRVLLQTEALADTWANPKGTWQTHMAAREVWKLVGDPKDIAFRCRPGGHAHEYGAFVTLMDLMQTGLAPEFNPFPDMELIFDWKAPAE